jgi:MFS family permease
MGAVERYRRVLRAPHIGRLWVVTTIARMGIGINGLAIVLAMREETGSFAAAGAAAGVHALVLGLANPFQGRLFDRIGPRTAVPPLIAWHVVTMGLFIVLLPVAPTGVLIALAALSGFGQPPWSAILRAMWPRLLGNESMITTAFALDSTLIELVFVLGPLIVAGAVAVAAPQIALIIALVFITVGGAMVVASPAIRSWEPEEHHGRGIFGALASPGLLTVVLATIPVGLAFGAFEISLPAFAEDHAERSDAGVLIALWAVGSAIGGLAYGARDWASTLPHRWLVLTAALCLLLLAPVVAGSMPVMGLLVMPAGACIAPAIASANQLMGTLSPPGMTTEAYAWGPTALVAGFAGGSALGGSLIEAHDWRAAVLLAAGAAALGALVGFARRSTLRPAPA